jgi:hypothetical protein
MNFNFCMKPEVAAAITNTHYSSTNQQLRLAINLNPKQPCPLPRSANSGAL